LTKCLKNNLKEERFILAHGVRGFSPYHMASLFLGLGVVRAGGTATWFNSEQKGGRDSERKHPRIFFLQLSLPLSF
jgi:hypothetical protein